MVRLMNLMLSILLGAISSIFVIICVGLVGQNFLDGQPHSVRFDFAVMGTMATICVGVLTTFINLIVTGVFRG